MHKSRIVVAVLSLLVAGLLLLAACGGGSSVPPTQSTSSYNGSASVGDLITITINHTTHTLIYQNLTNNQSGSSTYTVNSDGSFGSFSDTHLVKGWEISNYATFLQVTNAGPDAQTSALVIAPAQTTVTTSSFNSQNYNYMQFRTAGGGTHVGWVSVDALGNVAGNAYRPWQELDYELSTAATPYKSAVADGAVDLTNATVSPNGYLSYLQGGTKQLYIFGTNNGLFLMDTPKGTTLGLPKAASSSFSSSFAGTYPLMYYSKAVTANVNSVETGTPAMDTGSITFDTLGNATLTDGSGNTVWTGTLQPLSTAMNTLTNVPAGLGGDGCPGLFAARVSSGSQRKDIFVGFLPGQAGAPNVALVTFFKSPLTGGLVTTDQTYTYMYGVGVEQ